MTDAILSYRSMAYNNGWANHRLLAACAQLSQPEFIAPRTGFFPSVRATLNHILVVDLFYVDAMEGGTLGPAAWADPEPCATMDALRRAQADVDRRLIAVVEHLDPHGLERVVEVHRGTRIQRERMDRLLLHLFQHQIHHRGQAHGMLSGTAVPPPQLDEFFSAGEAPLRAVEFAQLGWTEEMVWRSKVQTTGNENMKPTSRPNGEAASANITKRIEELGDWRGETLAHIRQLIHDADPDIQEEWKWEKPKSPGIPVWSHDGVVCTGESYKQVVKLTFARGASIEDPSKLFNSSLEGNTRRAIDFREGEKIDEAAFKQLIRAAVAANSAARAQRAAKKK